MACTLDFIEILDDAEICETLQKKSDCCLVIGQRQICNMLLTVVLDGESTHFLADTLSLSAGQNFFGRHVEQLELQ